MYLLWNFLVQGTKAGKSFGFYIGALLNLVFGLLYKIMSFFSIFWTFITFILCEVMVSFHDCFTCRKACPDSKT